MKMNVTVTFDVSVEVDESKFTDDFMQNFKRYFYELDTIDEHAEHLAQLETRGLIDDNFVEGYGDLSEMGIKIKVNDIISEIEE